MIDIEYLLYTYSVLFYILLTNLLPRIVFPPFELPTQIHFFQFLSFSTLLLRSTLDVSLKNCWLCIQDASVHQNFSTPSRLGEQRDWCGLGNILDKGFGPSKTRLQLETLSPYPLNFHCSLCSWIQIGILGLDNEFGNAIRTPDEFFSPLICSTSFNLLHSLRN